MSDLKVSETEKSNHSKTATPAASRHSEQLLKTNSLKHLGCLSLTCLLSLALTHCSFSPPFNEFQKKPAKVKRLAAKDDTESGVNLGIGTIGTVTGNAIGTITSIYRDNKRTLINELRKQNIQFIEYGDTMTLIIPTDKYYVFDTPRLNDICYAGLNNVVKLLRLYHCSKVYVAGFTDNVGSKHHKKMLSQARAETMVGFLWANGTPARLLKPEGFADKHAIGDNRLIHGSAYNRRIEIQWFNVPEKPQYANQSMK